MRAGRYVKQSADYRAFVPTDLPPDPPIEMDSDLLKLLSDADRALGRLDGVATVLPNPDLFVAMFVRQFTKSAFRRRTSPGRSWTCASSIGS